MTRLRLRNYEPRFIREKLKESRELAKELHRKEQELVSLLREIDAKRFYVRIGLKSLRSYCVHSLKFTRTQSYRLVMAVRRPLEYEKVKAETSNPENVPAENQPSDETLTEENFTTLLDDGQLRANAPSHPTPLNP